MRRLGSLEARLMIIMGLNGNWNEESQDKVSQSKLRDKIKRSRGLSPALILSFAPFLLLRLLPSPQTFVVFRYWIHFQLHLTPRASKLELPDIGNDFSVTLSFFEPSLAKLSRSFFQVNDSAIGEFLSLSFLVSICSRTWCLNETFCRTSQVSL